MTDSNTPTSIRPPTWFWIVTALATVWNAIGVMNYIGFVTMTEEALAAMPQEQQELMTSTPSWVTAAFAIAVWGGLLGCVALLLRKKWATPVLIVSFIGVIVNFIHNFFVANIASVMGIVPIITSTLVIVIGAALIWLARMATAKGWIR